MQRLGAVVARADRDRLAVEERGDIVRVGPGSVNVTMPGALGGGARPMEGEARHLARQQRRARTP